MNSKMLKTDKDKMTIKKIIMIHVPKCAGITIRTVLENELIFFGNEFEHHYARTIKNKLGEDFDKLFSFAIIRNPWEKLWSGYKFIKFGSDFRKPKKHLFANDFNSYI